ncbi:MAG TPA: hypothetical protein P5535_09065, partial [Clostridia bacterium]|nr:hypothetical protein [Clostridia bacterium]
MSKVAFLGFGEVNAPRELIVKKCKKAENALKKEGLDLISIYPITDDSEREDVLKAIDKLSKASFGTIVLCVAGWIPSHAI